MALRGPYRGGVWLLPGCKKPGVRDAFLGADSARRGTVCPAQLV